MKTYTKEEMGEVLRLHDMWWKGIKRGKRAILDGANLNGANLNGANLNGASLNRASLNRASLNYASLNCANLNYANLYCANLNYAILDGASLNGANLNGASLYCASLNRASLNGASLDGASLKEGFKIKSKKQRYYQGSDYYCWFFGSIIKIGCEVHYYKDWKSFDWERIKQMDGNRAVKFWKKERSIILKISENLQKGR